MTTDQWARLRTKKSEQAARAEREAEVLAMDVLRVGLTGGFGVLDEGGEVFVFCKYGIDFVRKNASLSLDGQAFTKQENVNLWPGGFELVDEIEVTGTGHFQDNQVRFGVNDLFGGIRAKALI